MGKIFASITVFILSSCCFFMYSSIPPCELSIEWEKLVDDKKEKKKIVLVAPNQENENIQKFVREIAENLESSNTYFCRNCRILSNYTFAYEKADLNDFIKVDSLIQQRCVFSNLDSCNKRPIYRDIYGERWITPTIHYRDTIIGYYIPKESLTKENVFYIAFTKCDISSEEHDFYFNCRYSVWDSKNSKFFARGMLDPVLKGCSEIEAAKIIADILVIGLGLR